MGAINLIIAACTVLGRLQQLSPATMQAQAQAITLKGSCQIVCEFFKFALYNIFYQRGVFPDSSFTTIEKYNVQLKSLEDPTCVEYIDKTLNQCAAWMEENKVRKFILCLLNAQTEEVLEQWEFNVHTDPTVGPKDKSNKPVNEIRNEIRLMMMQIMTSNSILPPISGCITFEIFTHLDKDAEAPDNWEESKIGTIENECVFRLREFSTKIHKIDGAVRFKNDDGDLFN